MKESLDITDLFIDNGLIIEKKGRAPKANHKYKAKPYSSLDINLPLIILVNKATASGSEIIAGSLQYYKKAVIIGMKTFGSGKTYRVIPITEKKSIWLPIEIFYLANGKTIENNGIIPDIEVKNSNNIDAQLDEAVELLTQ